MHAFQIVHPPRWLPDSPAAAVIRLSPWVEAQYAERGAFPLLRASQAAQIDATGWAVHYLTKGQAEAIIADAERQIARRDRSTTIAFRTLIKATHKAMAEAEARPALVSATGPTLVTEAPGRYESWIGTRAQWLAVGLRVSGPWPGEPGSTGKANGHDERGGAAAITVHSEFWPDLFAVSIARPGRAAVAPALLPARADRAFQRTMAGLIGLPSPRR